MTEHRFDAATGFCQRCGVQKGSHAEECLAPENMISLQPYLRKRAWEKGKILGTDPRQDPIGYLEAKWKEGKLVEIAAETFPKEPA